jgi:hypothetical protein
MLRCYCVVSFLLFSSYLACFSLLSMISLLWASHHPKGYLERKLASLIKILHRGRLYDCCSSRQCTLWAWYKECKGTDLLQGTGKANKQLHERRG